MKIGPLEIANPVILAPMAGITDLPYRLMMKRFGAALVFTEMISASGLFFNGEGTRELLRTVPEEQPLGVQLFGDDPERLAAAACQVEPVAKLVDLNLGCPVRKVVGSGAGSALLLDPTKIARIVAAVRRATRLPLTVKIRSGWDNSRRNFLEVSRIVEEEGVDAITLHPRTRVQMFGGQANWQEITQLKQQSRIPVIASGDIFSAADAVAVMQQTGCDAIMIARGGYGNPWLISQILARLQGDTLPPPEAAERLAVAGEHLALFLTTFGAARTLGHMRKHLCWYTHGLAHAAVFRQRINQTRSVGELQELLHDFAANAA